MVVLYSDSVKKAKGLDKYSKLQKATNFILLCIIVLPLILIVRTHSKWAKFWPSSDFWITESYYYEQPSISHLNELLVILYTEQATHSFGTTADLNYLVDSHQNKVGVVSIQNKDTNADGKAEQV